MSATEVATFVTAAFAVATPIAVGAWRALVALRDFLEQEHARAQEERTKILEATREQAAQLRQSEAEIRDAHSRYVEGVLSVLAVERDEARVEMLTARLREAQDAHLDHLQLGARVAERLNLARLSDPAYVSSVWESVKAETPDESETATPEPLSLETEERLQQSLRVAHEMSHGLRSVTELLVEANAQRALRHFDQAIDLYSSAVSFSEAQGKPSADALYGRGVARHYAGRYEEALADFTTLIDLSKSDPEAQERLPAALNNRGNALSKLGRLDEALEDFNRSLDLRPLNPRTLYNIACAYSFNGNPERAMEYLAMALTEEDYPERRKARARADGDFEALRMDPTFGPRFAELTDSKLES
jgi:tetratricopeptide (TPR) repeat protein